MDAHSNDLVHVAAGEPADGSPCGLAKEELAYDKMDIEAIGKYLTSLKTTVNLILSQSIETASETDRPGYERRPNY